jgi:hypothetical protein
MKKIYESPVIQKMNGGLMNKFGTRTEYEPVKQIDGVSVQSLMAEYGSPLFVLSERTFAGITRMLTGPSVRDTPISSLPGVIKQIT